MGRHTARDYERHPEVSEALIRCAAVFREPGGTAARTSRARLAAVARRGHLTGVHRLTPAEIATVMSSTLASLPPFCDLLTHVPLSLEGYVGIERAPL
jgi:hypothetical protein